MTLVVQTYAPRGGRGRALYAYACVGGGAACRGDDAWACVSATSIAARADASEERGRDGETTTRDGGGSRARATNGVETYGTAERAPAMEDAWDDPESSAWCRSDRTKLTVAASSSAR